MRCAQVFPVTPAVRVFWHSALPVDKGQCLSSIRRPEEAAEDRPFSRISDSRDDRSAAWPPLREVRIQDSAQRGTTWPNTDMFSFERHDS